VPLSAEASKFLDAPVQPLFFNPQSCASTAMESSRIFVRGLPPKFTEDDVRKHFAKFPVTDVKFFPHRRIGYVGYKSPEDATKAVKYFNKTFINLTKIYAEIARPVSIGSE
jgi:multiple RNA-binding domain-containing protein 1